MKEIRVYRGGNAWYTWFPKATQHQLTVILHREDVARSGLHGRVIDKWVGRDNLVPLFTSPTDSSDPSSNEESSSPPTTSSSSSTRGMSCKASANMPYRLGRYMGSIKSKIVRGEFLRDLYEREVMVENAPFPVNCCTHDIVYSLWLEKEYTYELKKQ